ncbi:MAG: glycosyltransferase family 2 protein [Bacteroidota bacterium]
MLNKKISVIIPCYNEADNIIALYDRLTKVLAGLTDDYELLYVNNGSTDASDRIFRRLCAQDEKVTVICLSRNFGSSQPAYTCGMEHAAGDCVVCIDGDLQDPPELIPDMVAKWREGYDVVYGIRKKREGGLVRRIGYKLFYRLFKRLSYIDIPLDAGDFALLDREVVQALNRLPERNRFLRGLRAWVGFKQTGVEYVRAERKAGRTSNSFIDNIRWANMGIFSFSYRPLELISFLAIFVVALSAVGIVIYIASYFLYPSAPRGFSTLIVSILFIGGIQLLCLSIMGEYLGKIFEEVKQRPKYLVKEILHKDKTTKNRE